MRIVPVLVAALVFSLVPLTAPAQAKDGCPAGMIKECKPSSAAAKKGQEPCRCVPDPSASGSANQGKAEIKKKNVPQTQKTKKIGPYD